MGRTAGGAIALVALFGVGAVDAQDRVFGNGFEPRRYCELSAGPSVCPGFVASAPDFVVAPGEVTIRSYYFRSPNAAALAVRRISAIRSTAVAQLSLAATYVAGSPAECRPAATFQSGSCCEPVANATAFPLFIAQRPFDDLLFQSEDGNGVPLALRVAADTPLCLQITATNASAMAATASARVELEAQLPSLPHVATAPLLALTSTILIPAMSDGYTLQHTCTTRADTRFWGLTTRTFRRGVEARLSRGAVPLLQNLDWAAPEFATFGPPDFVAFDPTNRLRTTCTYVNPTTSSITFGLNPESDETCEAFGYFFPATTPALCIDGILVF